MWRVFLLWIRVNYRQMCLFFFSQFEAFQQLSKSEFGVFLFVILTDLARNLESKGGKHWLEVQSVLLEEKPVFHQLVGSEPLILPGTHTRH